MKTTLKDLTDRGVAEIIDEKSFLSRIKSGKKLRIKFGIDPTGPDIHLGHTIPLIKLRQFQDLGHKAVLIIGDYTATVGDPSGKDETRKALTFAQVKKNAEGYLDQAFRILDRKSTEVRYNSEWFKVMGVLGFLELQAKTTVPQLLAHETFRKRMTSNENTLSTQELMYPLLQGYDSVMVKADIELGGIDQKFNLLMGRQLQGVYGQKPQEIMMVNYLMGTDGNIKMGKSVGNYIALNDTPDDMFGKVMSIPDDLIPQYAELLTDWPLGRIKKLGKLAVGKGARELKAELAEAIVEKFYSAKDASGASDNFNKVFKQKEIPDDIPTYKTSRMSCDVVTLLNMVMLVESRGEAKRMIEQGGVKINGLKISDVNEKIAVHGGEVIQVGKRKFIKLVV